MTEYTVPEGYRLHPWMQSAMAEHPILFSAPMIRAVLDGRKTQTRRIVRPQPKDGVNDWTWDAEPGDVVMYHSWPTRLVESRGRNKRAAGELTPQPYKCPHGAPGDTLWVRETWAHVPTRDAANHVKWHGTLYTPRNCIYRADDPKLPPLRWGKEGFEPFKWAPSIFMPRWASRITLRITDVRVERLQDITEADAMAEGVPNSMNLSGGRSARGNFEHLWWQIHGDDAWEADPLVWVVEFERVEAPDV